MADLLRPVPIADLKHLEAGKAWSFEQAIDGLNALTPVKGQLHVQHQGTLLQVQGEAETLVNLCCDRCLQPFNHPLTMRCEEVLGLGDTLAADPEDWEHDGLSLEANGMEGALSETLDPHGQFDPERWVFEQLSLQWPLVSRCGSDCPGPERWSSQSGSTDPRWAALGQIEL